jgi:chemotaxis protein MotA
MEGVIAIESEINPIILKTKLESFLTPSERHGELVSYQKIKERFKIIEGQESPEPAAEPTATAATLYDQIHIS